MLESQYQLGILQPEEPHCIRFNLNSSLYYATPKKLQEQTGGELPANHQGHRIYLEDSDNNVIQILADPRFAAPLLILLDFVIVYIILALAGYAVAVFSLGRIGQIILTVT